MNLRLSTVATRPCAMMLLIVLCRPWAAMGQRSIFEEEPTTPTTRPNQPDGLPRKSIRPPIVPGPEQVPTPSRPLLPEAIVTPTSTPKSRLPKPSPAELGQSIKRLNDAYAAQLRDRAPSVRKQLARTLLDDVPTMASTPADQYALLLGAFNVSRESGSLAACNEAADRMMELFFVDTLPMKANALLTGPFPTDRSPEAIENLQVALQVADELVASEDYESANKLLAKLKATPSNPVLQAQILGKMKEVNGGIQEQKLVNAALEKLKANAEDASANRTVGSYRCLTRNDWTAGLPFLAKGSDESLKKLARVEIVAGSGVDQAERIADGWYDLAHAKDKTLNDAQKAACLRHAISWYDVARPTAQGLLLKKIGNRASEVTMAATARVQTKELVNSIGQKYTRIEKGNFVMGTPENEPNHHPNETMHKVTLTKPFYMGVYHVTRGEFEAFVNATKYQTDAERAGTGYVFEANALKRVKGSSWRTPGFTQSNTHPVVVVSQADALAYLNWLNALPAEKAAARHYRLPTEAEWEYACRAGTTTAFNTGATLQASQANCFNRKGTMPVGSFPANPWGLFDMHGNAWQWCSDAMADYTGDAENPTGATGGRAHVMRGGSWFDVPPDCRSGKRGTFDSGFCLLGFRVVLE